MGACNCNCVSDKQDKNTELDEDNNKIVKEEKQIGSNAVTLASSNPTKQFSELNPNDYQKVTEITPDPFTPLCQAQSAIRGFLIRKKYQQYVDMQPQSVPEVPNTISTTEAKRAYSRLSPFKFDKSVPDEPVEWKGPTRLLDGSVYVGEWSSEGFPQGKGIMYYIDGGICEGYWKEGKLHDKGRRVSPKGDIYTGTWNHGKMQDQGVMEFANKSTYTGSWANDKQHGQGCETWPDGSRFEGYFENGFKCGKGLFLWSDGTSYEGEFQKDVIEGFGKYKWTNRNYEGTWKDGKMHGKGLFKWDDGKVFEGEYNMDVKEGYGVLKWPDGKKYEGMWKAGKYHGEGTLFNRGKKRKGLWENGEFRQKIKD